MLMLLTVATFLYINNVRDIYATLVCSSAKEIKYASQPSSTFLLQSHTLTAWSQ